jgi:hypothetical protein
MLTALYALLFGSSSTPALVEDPRYSVEMEATSFSSDLDPASYEVTI